MLNNVRKTTHIVNITRKRKTKKIMRKEKNKDSRRNKITKEHKSRERQTCNNQTKTTMLSKHKKRKAKKNTENI